ncbi:MAG: hypothetical protein IJO55_05890 [Lachnospiraceae bacterium]|nr:hypothetical protein [Lachnospiraceae bacterium]
MKKMIKKFMLYFLTAVMIMGAVPFTTFADVDEDEDESIPPVYHKDDDNDALRLVIGKTEEVTIGKTSTISVTIKNTSEDDWKKTYVRIAPESYYLDYYEEIIEDEELDEDDSDIIRSVKTTYPFEITDSLNEYHNIGPIKAGGKKTANLRVSMKKNLEQGYYPVLINVTVEEEDESQRDFEKTMILWAETKSSSSTDDKDEENNPEPVAFSLGENQPTPHGVYNDVMNFHINMRNTGYKTAYDVRVEMELSEDVTKFPFEINDGNYDRWMGDVAAGQTVEVPYSMAIRKDAESGYYPIKYTIKYRAEENGGFETPIEDIMYVRIVGLDEEDDDLSADAGDNERTKARIIVESFQTEPETVMAGQEFTLKLRMKNASSQIAASNILFTLDPETVSDSPVFTTVNGSNSVVVNSLAPGASEELVMKFTSSPSAEQRSYTVTITEQYDSPEYKNAKETVKIAVPIKQQARLNTGNIEVMPNGIDVGNESNIMFDINNTGKVTLYNVTAIFEADSIQRSENYVGNIKPGESGNVDAMILGMAPTMDDGMINLTITYEDENGVVTPVEKELQLFVSEPVPMEDMFMDMGMEDMMMEEPEPTMMDKVKQYALPLGTAAVIVLGGIVFVIRRRKKKAGMEDEIL